MEPESGSPLLALSFSPNSIAVGTVIEARIPGGGRRWYPGKVSRDHGNGSYAVAYKYGHKEPLVHAHLMRIPPSDLSRALSEVADKVQSNGRIAWKSVSKAMEACLTTLSPGQRNAAVEKFARECMCQVLHVLSGLHEMKYEPRSMGELREQWKVGKKAEHERLFQSTLCDSMRVLLRIGQTCELDDLTGWANFVPLDKNQKGTSLHSSSWVDCLTVLLDNRQGAYRDQMSDEIPNTAWDAVTATFYGENGISILVQHLKSTKSGVISFPPEASLGPQQILKCKIARILRRLMRVPKITNTYEPLQADKEAEYVEPRSNSFRLLSFQQLSLFSLLSRCRDLSDEEMAIRDNVAAVLAGSQKKHLTSTARRYVDYISTAACSWLQVRIKSSPDKLASASSKMTNFEVVEIISDLMHDDHLLIFVMDLICDPTFQTQRAGVRTIRQLARRGRNMKLQIMEHGPSMMQACMAKFSGDRDILRAQFAEAAMPSAMPLISFMEDLSCLLSSELKDSCECIMSQVHLSLDATHLFNSLEGAWVYTDDFGILFPHTIYFLRREHRPEQCPKYDITVVDLDGNKIDMTLRCHLNVTAHSPSLVLSSPGLRMQLYFDHEALRSGTVILRGTCSCFKLYSRLHQVAFEPDQWSPCCLVRGEEIRFQETTSEGGENGVHVNMENVDRSMNEARRAKNAIDSVHHQWGALVIRCITSGDDHTLDMGIEMLESLQKSVVQHAFDASTLAPLAEHALDCVIPRVRPSPDTQLKDGGRLVCHLSALYHVLALARSERAAEVPNLWLDAAFARLIFLSCPRTRKEGFAMLQEAVRMRKDQTNLHPGRPHFADNREAIRGRMGAAFHEALSSKPRLNELFEGLFSRLYVDNDLLQLVGDWMVNCFYNPHCYELCDGNGEPDLMKSLFDIAIGGWGGCGDIAMNLIVQITLTNISIRSLNSLCEQFRTSVQQKATAALGTRLILDWIKNTRHKKWKLAVQERLMGILWTMLLTQPTRSVDVLEYFEQQFTNLRANWLGKWTKGVPDEDLDRNQVLALHCVCTYGIKCLQEIERSGLIMKGSMSTRADGYQPPHEQRLRATQAASLLSIILHVAGGDLQPRLLHEIHRCSSSVLLALVDEYHAVAYCSDIRQHDLLVRLDIIGMCRYSLANLNIKMDQVMESDEERMIRALRAKVTDGTSARQTRRVVMNMVTNQFHRDGLWSVSRGVCQLYSSLPSNLLHEIALHVNTRRSPAGSSAAPFATRPPLVSMFKEMGGLIETGMFSLCWSPMVHRYFPHSAQRAIRTCLLVQVRRNDFFLPPELWSNIFGFIGFNFSETGLAELPPSSRSSWIHLVQQGLRTASCTEDRPSPKELEWSAVAKLCGLAALNCIQCAQDTDVGIELISWLDYKCRELKERLSFHNEFPALDLSEEEIDAIPCLSEPWRCQRCMLDMEGHQDQCIYCRRARPSLNSRRQRNLSRVRALFREWSRSNGETSGPERTLVEVDERLYAPEFDEESRLDFDDMDDDDDDDEDDSLFRAAEHGHVETVGLILDRGAFIDSRAGSLMVGDLGQDGALHGIAITPLYIASRNGHLATVRLLLERGATVNVVDDDGRTALYVAAMNGHAETAQELLNHGAMIDAARDIGATPLFIAAQEGFDTIVALLLAAGANVDQGMNVGWSPLFVAAWQGHLTVVQLLLDGDADPSITSHQSHLNIPAQMNALEVARQQGHAAVATAIETHERQGSS